MRLQPPAAAAAASPSNLNRAVKTRLNRVGKYGWLTPEDVVYLSFYGFSGNQEELLSKLRAMPDKLSTAKTIVFDARNHPGGDWKEKGYLLIDADSLRTRR